jgi:5-hydroxyisourate hydrolase
MTVSTHVLDASAGRPAAGVSVTLSLIGPDGGWLDVESGATDAGGRYRFAARTPPGGYRLVFGTGRYFAARAVATFYPEVTIAFTIPEPDAGDPAASDEPHFHVPLLLSPFAYSTYRGS